MSERMSFSLVELLHYWARKLSHDARNQLNCRGSRLHSRIMHHERVLSLTPIILSSTPANTHTLKPFKELGLDSQRVKKLASSKLHVHCVTFAAKLVHTRRALSSSVINSHQEPVSGQACNPLSPH